MNAEIETFNEGQSTVEEQQICATLAATIYELLPQAESKIWHRHPVWFLDGNPTVGYSKLKAGIRLMFWSGASFDEDQVALPEQESSKTLQLIFHASLIKSC